MADSGYNDGEPLGYFITWTTYGTWLPGDERGWRRKGKPDIQLPNELNRESAACKMKEREFRMNRRDREIVHDTVTRHCEIRNWKLHIVNARSNHVHVVVTAPGYAPETVRDQLKAWCTRKLKPFHPGRERFWTEGGSRRYLNSDDHLEAAIIYVSEAQDMKGVEFEHFVQSRLQARRASE
jgi:REP element-mobilizing transposase RayT